MNDLEQVAKASLDHSVMKKNLAEKAEQSLTLAYNGGLFKVTPELISFVMFKYKDHDMIVKDEYGNPIKIPDVDDFMFKLREKYSEVMNDWHNEYEALKKIRKPEQL